MGTIDKRKLHHWLIVVRRLKVWQLVVLFVMLSFLSAYLLRQNNLGMIARREAVKQADQKGEDVRQQLLNLQHYVSAHMNTDMGEKGVYLENAYQKAYDAAIQKASQATNPNSAVYQQASLDCRSRFVGGRESFRNDYVQCVVEKVSSLGGGHDPLAGLKPPSVDLYRFNFVSPAWTPDLAGLSLLAAGLLLAVIVVRIVFAQLVRFLLKRRHR